MKAKKTGLFLALMLALAVVFTTAPAWAQSIVSGAITGTVTDPSGAVVPNATVTAKNVSTGETQTAATTGTGLYRIPLLKPGTYSVTVNAPSFGKTTRTAVVAVGQTTSLNIPLSTAAAATTVEVTATTPVIQTNNGNISSTYNTAQIESTPNPGNDVTYVAQLAPGTAMNTSSGGGYGNFTANGLPATSNLFTVNGNDEMDPYLNLNNSGASNLLLGANELQEATVVENGYTGQYGRQAGAQVNYSTLSGTNQFHGDAIYDYNNGFLNGNEWFTKQAGAARPNALSHQWAARLGGPIIKDKLFFFVDTEGLRYKLPTSTPVYVPTPAFQSYVLGNVGANNPGAVPFYQTMFNLYNGAPGIAGATPLTSSVDPNLGCGNPATGGIAPGAGFGAGAAPCADTFRSTVSNSSKEWMLTGRVDWNIGASDKAFFRFKTDHGTQPTFTDPISPTLFNATSIQPDYEGQANWTHTFGANLVNQFIGSGSWYSAIFKDPNQTAATSTFPANLVFSDLFTTLGGENFVFPQGRNVGQWQIVDDVSLSHGNHNFKFGANFRRNYVSDFSSGVLTTPLAVEVAMSDWASGIMDFYEQRFPAATEEPIRLYSFGLYAQDDWKIKPNFTVTMALRADRNSNATCLHNCFARFNTPFQSLAHDVNTPYNAVIQTGLSNAFPGLESIAWQPRAGFAWSILPNNENSPVLRGGVGLFSDLYPATLVDLFAHNPPLVNQFDLFGLPFSPTAPGNIFAAASAANASFLSGFNAGQTYTQIAATNPAFAPPAVNDVVPNVTNPKFLEWNLELQQPIGTRTALSVNYVGNHGYDIFVENPGLNAYCSPAVAGPGVCTSGFGPIPLTATDARFGTVNQLTNKGISNYNGVTASFQRKFGFGLNANVAYTFSHALDDVSNGGILPYSLNDSITRQMNPFGLAQNYGNADYDIRHYVSANWTWNSPFKFSNGILNAALGGWTLGNTIFFRSGLPYTVIDTGMASTIQNFANGVVPATYMGGANVNCGPPSPTNATPCFTAANFVPSTLETGFGTQRRNQFRGPHYFNTDLQISKTFPLTERLHFGIGANIFNILNHPNFSNPVNDIAAGNAGQIVSTVVPPTSPYGAFVGAAASPRIIQLQAKIIF